MNNEAAEMWEAVASNSSVVGTRLRHLTVRSSVRDYALETAEANKVPLSSGEPRFIRVSEAWLDSIEARVRSMVRAEVLRLPSKGRTIQ